MTDDTPGTGEAGPGPPWSVDTLADLHAGALDEETAGRLWPRVRADPEANAIIEALDATTADLGALADTSPCPVPGEVADRIDAALAEEASRAEQAPPAERRIDQQPPAGQGTADVVHINTAGRRRRRMLGWATGGVTTVAAAAVAIAVLVPGAAPRNGMNLAVTPSGPSTQAEQGSGHGSTLALSSGNLGGAVGKILGVHELGPLRGPQQLAACLAANGVDPDTNPVGVRPATIDGQRAVLILLTTGEVAQYRLLALTPDCGRNNPGVIADEIIGGS